MKNHVLFIVFDSCRYDSYCQASTPNIDRLAKAERRYAFASWTVPSHHVYMMGASPHTNPRGVFASEVYKKDFLKWSDRLGIPEVSFKNFVPFLSLPAFLQSQGYKTHALVSMPVLNQLTLLNKHFDRYELMDEHNDFSTMIDLLQFGSEPSFHLMNVGETHYPYTIKGETMEDSELLYGTKGVFKHSSEQMLELGGKISTMPTEELYHMDRLSLLHQKQVRNIEHLDKLFEKLYSVIPPNTHIIVTADHGELFGEGGFFGHGPVFHEKVFEVFFTEGKRP
jgi:arylsulfatase A-like enzyme